MKSSWFRYLKWFIHAFRTFMNSLQIHFRKWRSMMSLNRCKFDSRWFKWIHNTWKDANQINLRPQDGRNEAFRTWDLPLDGFRVEAYQIHYHKNSWVDLSLKLQDTLRGHREDTAGGGTVRTPWGHRWGQSGLHSWPYLHSIIWMNQSLTSTRTLQTYRC